MLGVATPNELIKNRRTTAYNVGTNLELRDFDSSVDDLSPLAAVLNPSPELSARLLERVLYWSGGQPYLTQKFCAEIVDNHIDDARAVDELVTQTFDNLGRASNDVHFQQILRFLRERLSDEAATIELYAKVLTGTRVPDRTTLAHAELKLSGLVKRYRDGNLMVRNPIYSRLFDASWVRVVAESAQFDRIRTGVEEKRARWEAQGCPNYLLAKGLQLAEADSLVKTYGEELSGPTYEFVKASRRRANRTQMLGWTSGAAFAVVALVAGIAAKVAEQETIQAKEQLQSALAALAVSDLEQRPVKAAKLAFAAWPRDRAMDIPNREVMLNVVSRTCWRE